MVQVSRQTQKMPLAQVILVVLLIVAAFLLGSLYSKVQYLEKSRPVGTNPTPAPTSKYSSFTEAIKAVAKAAKVDEGKLLSCLDSGVKKPIVEADFSQGTSLGVNGTPAFFLNGRLIPGAVPFEEFKKVIEEELSGKADPSVKRATVSLGNAPTVGPEKAAITLVEFSDFQCPFCARAYPTVKQILKEYSGKVRFAYKHFPLTSIHARAQATAEASECARDQGKFWEFHDQLFENQTDWASL